MSVGQEVFLVILPSHAYGERGYPPIVPSHATLLYTIHLLSYVSAEETSEMEFERTVMKDSSEIVEAAMGDIPDSRYDSERTEKE